VLRVPLRAGIALLHAWHGLVAEKQSWISFFPDYAATPIPARGVDPEVLRELLSAIQEKSALQITYQSMSQPEPTARWIEPHALAFDGFRWHARAFCQKDKVFKDFLLFARNYNFMN
jgi:predicted DNA-binding transcriptional regulator YafY